MFSVQDASHGLHPHRRRQRQGQEPDRRPKATPTSPCGSRSAPAAARASATRCSSTPTSPPTTSRPSTAASPWSSTRRSATHLGGAELDFKDGLQGAGFRDQQPQRPAQLRLRPELQLALPLHRPLHRRSRPLAPSRWRADPRVRRSGVLAAPEVVLGAARADAPTVAANQVVAVAPHHVQQVEATVLDSEERVEVARRARRWWRRPARRGW